MNRSNRGVPGIRVAHRPRNNRSTGYASPRINNTAAKPSAGGHERRSLRSALLTVLIVLLLTSLVLALPAFRLYNIEITETRMVTRKQVEDASGFLHGQHLLQGLGGSMRQLFELRYGHAELSITELPYVATARVSMHFPGAIEIRIEERVEVAYLSIPDGCVMIDKEGYALRIQPDIPDDIPIIEGIRVVSLSLGQPLTVNVTESMQGAVTLMGSILDADRDDRISVRLMDHVSRIRPAGSNLMYLSLVLPESAEELTVLAAMGGGLTDDMLWLRHAISQNVLSGYGKGVLDMSGEKRIFRPDGE